MYTGSRISHFLHLNAPAPLLVSSSRISTAFKTLRGHVFITNEGKGDVLCSLVLAVRRGGPTLQPSRRVARPTVTAAAASTNSRGTSFVDEDLRQLVALRHGPGLRQRDLRHHGLVIQLLYHRFPSSFPAICEHRRGCQRTRQSSRNAKHYSSRNIPVKAVVLQGIVHKATFWYDNILEKQCTRVLTECMKSVVHWQEERCMS